MKASVEHLRQQFAFTERRACRLLLVPVSSYRYKPRQTTLACATGWLHWRERSRASAIVVCTCCWAVRASR